MTFLMVVALKIIGARAWPGATCFTQTLKLVLKFVLDFLSVKN